MERDPKVVKPKLKQCRGECQRILPATLEYFHASSVRKGKRKTVHYLRNICKVCRNKHIKQYVAEKNSYLRASKIVHAVLGKSGING